MTSPEHDRSPPPANTTGHLSAAAGRSVDIQLKTFIAYGGVAVLFAPGMHALARLAGRTAPAG